MRDYSKEGGRVRVVESNDDLIEKNTLCLGSRYPS